MSQYQDETQERVAAYEHEKKRRGWYFIVIAFILGALVAGGFYLKTELDRQETRQDDSEKSAAKRETARDAKIAVLEAALEAQRKQFENCKDVSSNVKGCDEPVSPPPSSYPGPQGNQGLQGIPGPQGPIGPQGIQGKQGIPGPKGDKGDTGNTGATGAVGENGSTGSAGPPGPQGDPGPAGPKGETGATGPPGPTCPDGYTATPVTIITQDGPQNAIACIQQTP